MKPSYLYTPKDNFHKELPVNKDAPTTPRTPLGPAELDKITRELDQAFRFADNAGQHYTSHLYD